MNSLNPELKPKDTQSAIRNKLKELLTELKGFRFLMTLVFEFKKNKKWLIKPATIINENNVDYAFISVVWLYKTCKYLLKKFELDNWFSCRPLY